MMRVCRVLPTKGCLSLFMSWLFLLLFLSQHPTHIQGVKLGSVQPPSQQPDLESELIATNIALSNVLSKIEMGDLPYESMAEMDVMEHPDVATALSLVKRWNFLQESFQSSISSPNQVYYNIVDCSISFILPLADKNF